MDHRKNLEDILRFEGADALDFDADLAWRQWMEFRILCEAAHATTTRLAEEGSTDDVSPNRVWSLAFLDLAIKNGDPDNARIQRVAGVCREVVRLPIGRTLDIDERLQAEWMFAMLYSEEDDRDFLALCKKYDRRGVRGRLKGLFGRR